MNKKDNEKSSEELKTLSIDELRVYLETHLPLTIKREDVKRLTGLYAKSTLANADSKGLGPQNPIAIDSRTVAYLRPNLIDWIIKKIESERKRKGL